MAQAGEPMALRGDEQMFIAWGKRVFIILPQILPRRRRPARRPDPALASGSGTVWNGVMFQGPEK